jgi:hypothetical protein
MHVGPRGTAGNEVQSLRAQVMGTATGKNKVINIQGQQRKVIASWRLTSLESSQLPNDGRLEEVAPWFRFDAKLAPWLQDGAGGATEHPQTCPDSISGYLPR